MEQATKRQAPDRDAALTKAIDLLKPRLRDYLELRGARFVKQNQFHCIFNPEQHAHGDQNASGSIKGTGFTCFSCGAKGDIFNAVNMLENKPIKGAEFVDTVRYLCELLNVPFEENAKRATPRDELRPVATFVYTDENGAPLYRVIRKDKYYCGKPKLNKKGKIDKTFVQESFDASTGTWVSGLDASIKRRLYRLPDVLTAIAEGKPVYFVEGEKCADIVREKLGVTATCINGGAKSWTAPHTQRYIPAFCDAELVIFPDNDSPGKAFAETVASDVMGVVKSVKIVSLPGLSAGQDIEEWIKLHNEQPREDLAELIASAPAWSREKQQSDIFECSVRVERDCYWRIGDKGDICISNFVIHPVRKIVPEDPNLDPVWEVRAVGPDVDPIALTIKLDCFIDRKAFRKAFQNERLSFRGNDFDLQDIKTLFSREQHDEKRGVSYSGVHDLPNGEFCFVTKSRCIDATGADIDDVMLIENNVQLHTEILDVTTLTGDKAEISAFVRNLFRFNDITRTATIIGWACSCFLSEQLAKLDIKQPHIFISGEAGSGKSQTVEAVLMQMFSLQRKFAAGQLTDFVAMSASSSTNTTPLIIDEYKPHYIGVKRVACVSDLLRNTYDRQDMNRGKADLSVKVYKYRAPVVVIGEAGSMETAIKERGLELIFEKKTTLAKEHTDAFRALKSNPTKLRQLGRSLLMTAMRLTPDEIATNLDIVRGATTQLIHSMIPGIPPRIEDSIFCCINGLYLMEQLMNSLDIDLYAAIDIPQNRIFSAVVEAVKSYVLDDQDGTKSAVSQILETMARMATGSQAVYTNGQDYRLSDDLTTLWLDINGMYDRYLKYYREFSLTHESLDYMSFRKQLKGMSYCSNIAKSVRLSSNSKPQKVAEIKVQSLGGLDLFGFGIPDIGSIFEEEE